MRKTKTNPTIFALLTLMIAAVLFRLADLYLPVNRDSGLFAYGGWRILCGEKPYIDFFDNKLPGIFYVNALAMALFGVSAKGIVLFQMIWGALTSWVFYGVCKKFVSSKLALIVSLVFTFYFASYALAEGGNHAECYTSLFVLTAVWLVMSRGKYGCFIAGVLTVLAAVIKQPAFAVFLPLFVYLIIEKRKADAVMLAAGAVISSALFLLWLHLTGMLPGALDANLVFNKLYFKDAYTDGLKTGIFNLKKGLVIIALPVVGALVGFTALGREKLSLRVLSALWFVTDILGLAMGGRYACYYFLQVLPMLFLMTAAALKVYAATPKSRTAAGLIALFLFFGPVWHIETGIKPIYSVAQRNIYISNYVTDKRINEHELMPFENIAEVIDEHSEPDDMIYIWGWETRAAFAAKRKIASKYLHAHPLGATGFNRDERIKQVAEDIKKNKPKFIVDCSAFVPGTVPALSDRSEKYGCDFFRLDGYGPVQDAVEANYTLAAEIDGCPFYVIKPDAE